MKFFFTIIKGEELSIHAIEWWFDWLFYLSEFILNQQGTNIKFSQLIEEIGFALSPIKQVLIPFLTLIFLQSSKQPLETLQFDVTLLLLCEQFRKRGILDLSQANEIQSQKGLLFFALLLVKIPNNSNIVRKKTQKKTLN